MKKNTCESCGKKFSEKPTGTIDHECLCSDCAEEYFSEVEQDEDNIDEYLY